MTSSLTLSPKDIPVSRRSRSLLSVDRAVAELRRGRMVLVRGHHGQADLMMAGEAATADALRTLEATAAGRPLLAITARRAAVLGLGPTPKGRDVMLVGFEGNGQGNEEDQTERIARLVDPTSGEHPIDLTGINKDICHAGDAHSNPSAAIRLLKIARLLPAAVIGTLGDAVVGDLDAWAVRHDMFIVDSGDIFQYDRVMAASLRPVSAADVPLEGAENARIVAFRPADGGLEHLAIIINAPDVTKSVLVRLHSECFTGDLLSSLKCDCGDQLRGAIEKISAEGGGILLYLAQEGRGIGLVNKLKAYTLQDSGLDTVDANEQLGFDADERVYFPAVSILRALGIETVHLLTNNPEKVAGLTAHAITVSARIPHTFPSNKHNEHYLHTKARRSGHIL